MPDHDRVTERIARLQRVAYGADVDDEDRAAAEAELAALRSAPGEGVARPERNAAAAASGDPPDRALHGAADARPASTSSRFVGAVVIALLAGFAAGWTLDAVVSRIAEPRTITASETEAWKIFDFPPPNGQRVRYPAPRVDLDLDRESRRVLAARGDGVRLVAIRSVDGRDGCLVLIVTAGSSTAACTSEGRFPSEGLVAETEDPEAGFYSATWDATGRISLAPASPAD